MNFGSENKAIWDEKLWWMVLNEWLLGHLINKMSKLTPSDPISNALIMKQQQKIVTSSSNNNII